MTENSQLPAQKRCLGIGVLPGERQERAWQSDEGQATEMQDVLQ